MSGERDASEIDSMEEGVSACMCVWVCGCMGVAFGRREKELAGLESVHVLSKGPLDRTSEVIGVSDFFSPLSMSLALTSHTFTFHSRFLSSSRVGSSGSSNKSSKTDDSSSSNRSGVPLYPSSHTYRSGERTKKLRQDHLPRPHTYTHPPSTTQGQGEKGDEQLGREERPGQ